MRVRVRTPDGGTLKLEAEPEDSMGVLLASALSFWSAGGEASTAMLSLNKKDALDESCTLRDHGVRGGDLLHLISFSDVVMRGAESEGSTRRSEGVSVSKELSSEPRQEPPGRSPFGLPTVSLCCCT